MFTYQPKSKPAHDSFFTTAVVSAQQDGTQLPPAARRKSARDYIARISAALSLVVIFCIEGWGVGHLWHDRFNLTQAECEVLHGQVVENRMEESVSYFLRLTLSVHANDEVFAATDPGANLPYNSRKDASVALVKFHARSNKRYRCWYDGHDHLVALLNRPSVIDMVILIILGCIVGPLVALGTLLGLSKSVPGAGELDREIGSNSKRLAKRSELSIEFL